MNDTPTGGLTPPGPSMEPERPTGGMSVDDWLETQGRHPTPTQPGVPTSATEWRDLDRTSVWAFALGLSWCLSPVAVVLGIRGLQETSGGEKKGRWAAVSGLILGIVGTLALGLGVFGVEWFRDNIKAIDRVEVGECVDVDETDDTLSFFVVDCDERHHAEIAATGKIDAEAETSWQISSSAAEFCHEIVGDRYREAAASGLYAVTLAVDGSREGDPQIGDSYACFFTTIDGTLLSGPVGPPEKQVESPRGSA